MAHVAVTGTAKDDDDCLRQTLLFQAAPVDDEAWREQHYAQ
jgi:hypothetical protein